MATNPEHPDKKFYESLKDAQLDQYLRQYVDVVYSLLRKGIPQVGNLEHIKPDDRYHHGRRYFPTVYHRLSLHVIDQIARDIKMLVEVIWQRSNPDEPPHPEGFDSASFVGRETEELITDITCNISEISQNLFAKFLPTQTEERIEEKRQTIRLIINNATAVQYTAMELVKRGYAEA